ncbi:MAG: mycothiol transferase [Chloroflexota bacterium]
MELQGLLTDAFGRVEDALAEALNGLEPADLRQMPTPDTNSIGWLAWHLTRVQDDHVSDLMGEQQLYLREGWHARFDRPADPKDVGWGHTLAQVAAFRSPDVQTLIDYYHAVSERTKGFIACLTPSDLDRELNEPWYQPLPTVGVRLVSVLADDLQHVGQLAYVRGLLKGKGWLPY